MHSTYLQAEPVNMSISRAFHVSWMMFQYLLAEDTCVDMRINLCGTDILMAKQRLDDTQIGTTFE